jgi:hypothetical protein
VSGTLSKLLLLGALALSTLAGSAATASAVTWNSNGTASGTPFTATAPTARFVLSGISAGVTCTRPSATGLLYGPTGTVGTNQVADLSLSFTGCVTGGLSAAVRCAANDVGLWVTSYSSPIARGTLNAAASSVCTVLVPSVLNCTLLVNPTNGAGTPILSTTYTNAAGTLVFSTTGQALTGSWSNCGTLFGSSSGSAAITFGAGTTNTYTITSPFVPNVTI